MRVLLITAALCIAGIEVSITGGMITGAHQEGISIGELCAKMNDAAISCNASPSPCKSLCVFQQLGLKDGWNKAGSTMFNDVIVNPLTPGNVNKEPVKKCAAPIGRNSCDDYI